MFKNLGRMFSTKNRDAELQQRLDALRDKMPVPVFWLFGKTQTGKTSIVKLLTGAEEAEIGQGFKPCTRFSRRYDFPNEEAPLLTFLDTRGLGEPDYDAKVDIERFDELSHVVLVTIKAMDHAQEKVIEHLRAIRKSRPDRPIVLAATCLHEAYPRQQHASPYADVRWEGTPSTPAASEQPGCSNGANTACGLAIPEELKKSLQEQRRRFDGLYDHFVPIDLTKKEEGFDEPNYGGEQLKETLIDALPAAYRQTLITLDEATGELSDVYARHAIPHIAGYSALAGAAGAIPVPFVDLLIVPGIQTRMIYHLAKFYGQPLRAERFLELASTLGLGMLVRHGVRQLMKFIPYVGSVAGAGLAGASTFALGKAFCYYYSAVHRGQVPQAEDLRNYYKEQLAQAKKVWKRRSGEDSSEIDNGKEYHPNAAPKEQIDT